MMMQLADRGPTQSPVIDNARLLRTSESVAVSCHDGNSLADSLVAKLCARTLMRMKM